MPNNSNLNKAKKGKKDEFYTQFDMVEKELTYYKKHLKNKIVLCNCDNPETSAFWEYFHLNFADLGLKKLISTYYNEEGTSFETEYAGGDDKNIKKGTKMPLNGNGDFESDECLNILDKCDIVVTNPPFSCYSSDTEVMTNHGWKLIKNVNIDKDIIMSLNPENKQIEMVKAVDSISSPANGELYHFHNQNMDFCVTGNHRMYAYHKDAHNNIKPIPLVNAEDVKKSYLLPLKGFSWIGKQTEYFHLPETVQLEQYSRKEIVVPKKEIPMKDWLEFFGFWLADGCWRDHINTYGKRDYTISVKQNEQNEQYVLNLIRRIGFTATVSKRGDGNNNYNVYSKQLWEYLSQFGRSADKHIPREFLELNTDLLRCLFQGYLNGDGSRCADGHYQLSSASKSLMDDIQELILKIYGITTQIRKAEIKHSYDNEVGIYYSINVLFERRTEFSKYGVPDKIPYDDNVYCLTLEKNHIMLVRHNGIIGWCGNCFRDYMASLVEHKKKFLIVGNMNAMTYKQIFPLFKKNLLWYGASIHSGDRKFYVPDDYPLNAWGCGIDENGKKFIRVKGVRWFTNLDYPSRHNFKLELQERYVPEKYHKYDDYNAINVNKVAEIPVDYDGVMGVPITFMDKYDSEQFEILGMASSWDKSDEVKAIRTASKYGSGPILNGNEIYKCILIRKK